MQVDRHKAIWLKMLSIKEIRMKRDVAKLLKKQGKEIAAAFKTGGHAPAESMVIHSANDWHRVLIPNYVVCIKDFSQYLLDAMNIKARKASFTDLTLAFIERQAVGAAKNLTDTTKNILTGVILQGQKDGLGVEDIANNIVDKIGNDVARAATIARTETHSAAGYGMQAQASNIGFPVTKTWVAVEDERTRDTHAEVDGTEIPNDDYFDVGDDRMLYPGDPDADVSNLVNCRCTLVYSPSDNSEVIRDE